MMLHLYQFLLETLYPRGYSATFGEEMLSVFAQASAEQKKRGYAAYAAFATSEIAGLVLGVWHERMAPPMANEPFVDSDLPGEIQQCHSRLRAAHAGMVRALAQHDFVRARQFSQSDREHRDRLRVLRRKYGLNEG